MPHVKDYEALSKYLTEHKNMDLVVRVRSKTRKIACANELHDLKSRVEEWRQAEQTLKAFLDLCKATPVVTSDLHACMDAAILGRHMALIFDRAADRVRSSLSAYLDYTRGQDDDFDNGDDSAKAWFVVVSKEVGVLLEQQYIQAKAYLSNSRADKPEARSSETKLLDIDKGRSVGVYQSFYKKNQANLETIQGVWSRLIAFAEELIAAWDEVLYVREPAFF